MQGFFSDGMWRVHFNPDISTATIKIIAELKPFSITWRISLASPNKTFKENHPLVPLF
jgi:hypothetical protein